MSKGYRNGAFAIGLLTGGGIVLNLFLWSAYRANKTGEGEKPIPEDAQSHPWVSIWDRFISTFIDPYDTIAQWSMAALSLVAVYLLWETLKASRKTLSATQEMTRDSKEIGEAQTRAYLSIKIAKAFVDEKDGIVFEIEVHNTGNSPARDVHAIVSVWVNRSVTLPASMGGEKVMTSVQVFSRSVHLGDITAGETALSGRFKTHDLSFPKDVVRNENGVIQPGTGNVAVFAEDVFKKRIFESDGVLVACGEKQFNDWNQHGNFNIRPPFGVFGDINALRDRGWRAYEEQDHKSPF